MSISAFLIASNSSKPITAFAGEDGESEQLDFENWLLAAGYSIPLLWFFLFRPQDLMDYPADLEEDGDPHPQLKIPCTPCKAAAENLRKRLPLLNKWFGAKGSLEYHVNLFSNWLDTLPYEYVTLEWYELAAEQPDSYYEDCIRSIEREDDAIRSRLIEASSIIPAERFITLEEAEAGRFTEKQKHNFFFLLGDGDHHTPPWS
jgi:hypothetical protein